MNHLERALGRAKNDINLSSAEKASLKQALEWKVKPVRIPADYRHHVWWQGLALVLPLIVIFFLAKPVVAPKQEVKPVQPEPGPERVMLKQEIVLPSPALTAPLVPASTPSSAGSMMLMRATTSTSTEINYQP